jgi:hypothetical protein
MSRPQKPEDVAVPDVDVVGETIQGIGEAGAEELPNPPQPPRAGQEPSPAQHSQDQEEEHIGGARGPQDPGPWGSDEAIRNQPAWGSGEDNPMDEGSE